jgi:hypothetical protein
MLLAALDEQRFEQALQRADLLANCRLRDVVDLSRLGEALRFSQIAKDFQTLNLHKHWKYSITGNQSTNDLQKDLL